MQDGQVAEINAVRLLAWYVVDFPGVSAIGQWSAEDLAQLIKTGRWRTSTPQEDLALQSYGDKVLDDLLNNMPRAVLETAGGIVLLRSLAAADRDLAGLMGPAAGVDWELVDFRISLWSFGIGLVVLEYDLPPRAWADLTSLTITTRDGIYGRVSDVRHLMQVFVGHSTRSLATHARDLSVLWGNPNYLVRVASDQSLETRQRVAEIITSDGLNCRMEGYLPSVVRVGLHCSVVSEKFEDGAVDLLVRLGGVHQVCWAIALVHDAKLAAEVARISPRNPAPQISELRNQADRILGEYHQVRSFRMLYSSVESHLMPAAKVLWRVLEEAWKFERVMAILDDRLDFARTLHQQLSSTVSDHRSRLLNELVAAFTFLNIFSIIIAALTFGVLPSVAQRVAPLVVIAVILVVNSVAYLIFRRKVNRHR